MFALVSSIVILLLFMDIIVYQRREKWRIIISVKLVVDSEIKRNKLGLYLDKKNFDMEKK